MGYRPHPLPGEIDEGVYSVVIQHPARPFEVERGVLFVGLLERLSLVGLLGLLGLLGPLSPLGNFPNGHSRLKVLSQTPPPSGHPL